jgi:putative addiction module killer protein
MHGPEIPLRGKLDISYPIRYDKDMIEVRQTEVFADWFNALRDMPAKARIHARIDRAAMGNFGDCIPVGEGVSEMRIHYGPGYRLYFVQRGRELVVLLAGGDKSTQKRDINTALDMARNI